MKRWLPEIEQKIKYAFNVIKNENETVQYLLNLGLTTHEIDLMLQHFLSNAEYKMRKQEQFQYQQQQMENQARNPLSAQEQQLELIGFSQSVCYMMLHRINRILNCNFQFILWVFVELKSFTLVFFLLWFSFIC